MKRREFLKLSGMVLATAAVSRIPIPKAPYLLPYWKDLMKTGEWYHIVLRWKGNQKMYLTVNGVQCDPRDDVCTKDGIKFSVFRLSEPIIEGKLMFWMFPQKEFFEDNFTCCFDEILLYSNHNEPDFFWVSQSCLEALND